VVELTRSCLTSFPIACTTQAAEVRRLVDEESVPATHSNVVGQTALHIACLWGSYESAQILVASGANVNAQNKMAGTTPLQCAIRGLAHSFKETHAKRLQCVTLLLEAGADAKLSDFRGSDAFECIADAILEAEQRGVGSIEAEMKEMTDALAGAGINKSLLLQCVENGDVEGLKACLESDGNVSQKEKNKVLLTAVDKLKAFVDEGSNDEEAFAFATDMIRCLLEGGADANARSTSSDPFASLEWEPLAMIAACICSAFPYNAKFAMPFVSKASKYLLAHGAKVDDNTEMLLPTAAHRGKLDALQFLVEVVGVDPNTKGRQGMTALHFAARAGKIDVVKWLLDYCDNIDIDIVDGVGKKAIDYATANSKQEIVGLLSKVGN
jgi:ankyrin repeat protein